MRAPYEKHYSYNASGPDPDATGIWDAHIHRDVPRGDPGIWDSHIHMGAPYEKHYSYNASGPPRREPWALRPLAIALFPLCFVFNFFFRLATKDF